MGKNSRNRMLRGPLGRLTGRQKMAERVETRSDRITEAICRASVQRAGVEWCSVLFPPVYRVLVSEQSERKGRVRDGSDIELLARLSEARCNRISAQ